MSTEIIVKSGQLEKEGGGALTRWQARRFILTSTQFSWFKETDLRTAQGSIAVGEITGTEKQLGERQGRTNVFTVSTGQKSYKLAAPSKDERDEWLLALSPATHAEYAAKAAAGSAQAPPAKKDDVLENVKKMAQQIKEEKGIDLGERRETVLIPIKKDTPDGPAKQPTAPQSGPGELTPEISNSRTLFAVVEVFISHGLRISGSVANQMYTMLGQGVSSDRKHLDKRGWYCDRSFTLCSVLQTFMTNGWSLYRVSQSLSMNPWESTLVPVNLMVFVRGPGADDLLKPISRSFDSVSDSRSSTLQRDVTSAMNTMKNQQGVKLLDGGDNAELQDLMQQFNIPLDLLYVKT